MHIEGVPCPYKAECQASKIIKGSEFAIAASTLAASASASQVGTNSRYFISMEDMDAVADYGYIPASSGGGGGGEIAKALSPVLIARLKDMGCAPLSHEEVALLRSWITEKHQGVVRVDNNDPNTLDPYVKATTKACPTCTFRSSHYHGHQCHHISPVTRFVWCIFSNMLFINTHVVFNCFSIVQNSKQLMTVCYIVYIIWNYILFRGCPNCHVSYCYKCLSTETSNLKERGNYNSCKCGYWSNFCSTLKDKEDVKNNVIMDEGIPRDKRCGCAFCSECSYKKPCSSCSGDCSVCR